MFVELASLKQLLDMLDPVVACILEFALPHSDALTCFIDFLCATPHVPLWGEIR